MLQRLAVALVPLFLLSGVRSAAVASAVPMPVTASSVHDARYEAEYAIDGRPDTRWASAAGRGVSEWLQIDLGRSVPVATVTLLWEAAYAAEYQVQASEDGREWVTLRHVTDGRGGRETLSGLAGRGRYLRILCLKPGPFPLASLWEVSSDDAVLAEAIAGAAQRVAQIRWEAGAEARRRLALRLQQQGVRSILFAVRQPGVDGHWYANFGYYAADPSQKCYRAGGGQLCRYDVATGRVSVIFEDPRGSIRDPQVHYDGEKILFSYLKGGTSHYHLYEIRTDGTGLRQLTDGDCDDIEPTYLPDGGIAFCSSRCNRWVNCWLTPVATLYRCDADGRRVRPISANVEHDNTPWVLPDGRILYMRWEYVDRSQVDYHHLWTANPDGTGQMTFFGNMHPGTAMLDAKPIPGTHRVVSIFSPGHGQLEHAGDVTIVDPSDGPDNLARARMISRGSTYRDPFPLAEDLFLVANGSEVQLMDDRGETLPLVRLPAGAIAAGMWCHEPRPITPRPRERIVAPRVRLDQQTGRLFLANIYEGRNMAGVRKGEIRKLLILESLPKPINYTGGMDPLTYGGSFTLERIVGTVPVEPDGSAYFELPALRPFVLVALDERNDTVKRMQSFLTVQPGETVGCVGCHERRTQTPVGASRPLAMRRPPSVPVPVTGVPEVFDFPRDIQPVLDRHCVPCHDYRAHAGFEGGPRAGGVVLTGDRGPMFSHSYVELTWRRQFVDGRNDPRSNLPPRSIGAVASPLMHKILRGHHGVRLTEREVDLVRYWIEAGAPYPGTYGALGGGSIGGYYANNQVEVDTEWPVTQAAGSVIDRRCASCHSGERVLPRSLSDERDVSFWRPDWNDPRLKLSRHRLFNLTRPELSLVLLAPLARGSGGYESCGSPVFASTDDPDYQALLALCVAGKARLEQIKRFDMPGFRPPNPYLREMVRYGILPAIPPEGEPVDTYALDQAYWRSLWWSPRPE